MNASGLRNTRLHREIKALVRDIFGKYADPRLTDPTFQRLFIPVQAKMMRDPDFRHVLPIHVVEHDFFSRYREKGLSQKRRAEFAIPRETGKAILTPIEDVSEDIENFR